MHTYRGWRSTKLGLTLISMALIFAAYGLAGFPSELFGEFCVALLGGAGIYSGASVAEKRLSKTKPTEDAR